MARTLLSWLISEKNKLKPAGIPIDIPLFESVAALEAGQLNIVRKMKKRSLASNNVSYDGFDSTIKRCLEDPEIDQLMSEMKKTQSDFVEKRSV